MKGYNVGSCVDALCEILANKYCEDAFDINLYGYINETFLNQILELFSKYNPLEQDHDEMVSLTKMIALDSVEHGFKEAFPLAGKFVMDLLINKGCDDNRKENF